MPSLLRRTYERKGWKRDASGKILPVGKIQTSCPTCGIRRDRYLSDIRRGARFCSQKCASAAHLRRPNAQTEELRSCEICGRWFWRIPALIAKGGGRYCSKPCYGKAKINPERTAEQRFYNSDIWAEVRRQVYQRDNYRCVDCGSGREGGKRVAHHLKPLRDNGNPLNIDNLITLCVTCHNKRHDKFGTNNPRRRTHAIRTV